MAKRITEQTNIGKTRASVWYHAYDRETGEPIGDPHNIVSFADDWSAELEELKSFAVRTWGYPINAQWYELSDGETYIESFITCDAD